MTSKTHDTSPLDAAIAVKNELAAKLTALQDRHPGLRRERDEIALAAHTGNAAAAERLEAINQEFGVLASQIGSLEAAIRQADVQIGVERGKVAAAAVRERQVEVERLRQHMRTLATKADTMLQDFIAAAHQIEVTTSALAALGESRPSLHTVRTGLRNSLLAQPIGTHLSFEYLPPIPLPSQRHTVTELALTWFGPEPAVSKAA